MRGYKNSHQADSPTHGFAIINLLLALAIILVLLITQLKLLNRQQHLEDTGLQELLKADLRTFASNRRQTDTSNNVVAMRHELKLPNVHYYASNSEFLRIDKNGSQSLLSRVTQVEFSYRKNGKPLLVPLDHSALLSWQELLLTLWQHDQEESSDHFSNDGITGIDLDGDPGNGTASVTAHRLHFSLK